MRITWEEAVRATMAAAVDENTERGLAATEQKITDTTKMDDGTTIRTWATNANAWIEVNKGSKPGKDLKPVYIAVCRPFIEHTMHSAILAVNGADTGVTLFGPSDMQISANTQVKTIEGHCEQPPSPSNTHTHLAVASCTC